MTTRSRIAAAVGAGLLCGAPAAQAVDFALGAQAGTLGLGASATVGLNRQFNLRAQFNAFGTDFDDESGDIEYEFDLDLGSIGLLLDWHVGGSGFRVSAGAFVNNNEATGVGRPLPGTVIDIGDQQFDGDDIGRADAELTFDDVAPYIGIGWGNAVGPDKRLGFYVDVGVLFQGEPEVAFRATASDTAPAGTQDLLDAQVAAEQARIQEDIDQFDLYPVLALGFSYKF